MRAVVAQISLRFSVAAVVLGCGPRVEVAATQPAAAQPAAAAHAEAKLAITPPAFTFTPPQPWHSKRASAPPVDAPDLTHEAWRALVNQNAPIQAKTPHWQALPAGETVELQMPPDSRFRCIAPPLEVTPQTNTLRTELKAWRMARRVLCSSDGWHSWTESTLRVRQVVAGEREIGDDAGLLLREQDTGGRVRQTFVLLRSEPEQREASTGPPRVVLGLKLDDDD
jgi:hypothetical protein